MTMLGAVPSRLQSLVELAGQPRDLNDRVTAQYTEMLERKLDPKGTTARKAAEKIVKKEVINPTRDAMKVIGVITD